MIAGVTYRGILCVFKTREIKDKYVRNAELPYETTFKRIRNTPEFKESLSTGSINQISVNKKTIDMRNNNK